jgi:hypothetical protein
MKLLFTLLAAALLAGPTAAQAQNVQQQIAALQSQVTALKSQVSTLQTDDAASKSQLASLQSTNATLQNQVASLQASVGNLQSANTTLQNQVAALQSSSNTASGQISSLQSSNTAVQNQLAAAANVLALNPFVTVDPNPENGVIGPHITFHNANIHIVSGSGATDDSSGSGGSLTGLGNLFIGYNELPASNPNPGYRAGSHNLVIGPGHQFTSYGGFLAGYSNILQAASSSICGGSFNLIGPGSAAQYCSILGGDHNLTAAQNATIVGGQYNGVENDYASVMGGSSNNARAKWSTIVGGDSNATIGAGSILGGQNNIVTALGSWATILGGYGLSTTNGTVIFPNPPFPQ